MAESERSLNSQVHVLCALRWLDAGCCTNNHVLVSFYSQLEEKRNSLALAEGQLRQKVEGFESLLKQKEDALRSSQAKVCAVNSEPR